MQNLVNKSPASARRNEDRIKSDALQMQNWSHSIAFADCRSSRGNPGGCPNNHKCRHAFSSLEVLTNAIKYMRERIYDPSLRRRAVIRSMLEDMRLGNTISFKMAGIRTCKNFFREASGIRRQLFDEIVDEVLNKPPPVESVVSPLI